MRLNSYILDFTVKQAITLVKDYFGINTKKARQYIIDCIKADPKQIDPILNGIDQYNRMQSKTTFYYD